QQIEATDEQIALTRHAIAALLAEPPQRFETLAPKLSTLHPIAVPGVAPADLVGHRADVVAERWRVEAAAGDVAAQRAQFYPNVNLTAFIGLGTLGLDRLIDAGSLQWGVGPAIRLPIFDAGPVRAGRRSPCRYSPRAGCARACAAAPRTSMPLSRRTTRRSSMRSTTSPTRS